MNRGRILEFLIIGIMAGILEDIIAVKASTGTIITWNVIGIVTLVAIPFAVLSELIVDHFKPFHRKPKKQQSKREK